MRIVDVGDGEIGGTVSAISTSGGGVQATADTASKKRSMDKI
jgi:hypothetical protein